VNPSSEAQERLVVSERVRLERVRAAQPLRPGGWRLARDGGGGEVRLGIARDVRIGAVPVDPEQTAPAKVPLDAPDGAKEHGADLARLQVGEPLPAQLAALLLPGAIESDHVQVRVQPQIGRGPLHDRDRPGLCAQGALPSRTLGVERVHRLHEDAREVAEQRPVLGQPPAPRERERQHPLAARENPGRP
jgi:hypothetical protein